jgi:DNA polymerase-3 subunit beta
MNVVILKNNLKEGLQIVSGIRPGTSTLPVLKNILIEAHDGNITLSATDLEMGVVHHVSAKVIEKGSVAVPFQIFSQIIQNLSSERVTLELQDATLLVTTDNYRAKVSITSKDDFPIIPTLKEQITHVEISAETFISALTAILPACQVSEIRPELSGILFRITQEGLVLVATDSFRLAEKTISKKQLSSTEEECSYIIPYKTAQEIVRIFSTVSESITIAFDKNQVSCTSKSTTLISRLIQGIFPEYQVIIPKEFLTKGTVDIQDLSSALKLTSSLSNKLHEVVLKSQGGKTLTIFSASQEFGENEYVLPAKLQGEDAQVVFNWKFVLDGIRPLASKEVFVGINGEEKPSIFRSPEDTTFLYVVMPIKSS